MAKWTTDDIGDQTGRRVLITGITGGLGRYTARELARHGAELLVTARDSAKAAETLAWLEREAPGASIEPVDLDLADLSAVAASAQDVLARAGGRIDVLINNAGIMIPPERRTVDGFELQIATNHLGHFAFTAALWPLLKASSARLVQVSSIAHTSVRGLDLASLSPEGSQRKYRRWQSYGESKLANLLFMLELDRRVKAAGIDVLSVAAHPGYSSTNLTKTGMEVGGGGIPGLAMHQITKVIAQPAHAGAWPLLMAATDPSLVGGDYIGPNGFRQMRGRPVKVGMTATARDEGLASALWTASEIAAGLTFEI